MLFACVVCLSIPPMLSTEVGDDRVAEFAFGPIVMFVELVVWVELIE